LHQLAGIANLVNGCACCSLKADVVSALAGWCDLPEAVRPQRVVLETTGLADPTDLVDLEHEPTLEGRLRLAGCLTVVSCLTPLDHLVQKPLLRRQTALASLVYLVLVHKLEYFVNAKIVGGRIHAQIWEVILAMVLMEIAFGTPGLVFAPILYAYLRGELREQKWV